jgi:uncharacterized protein
MSRSIHVWIYPTKSCNFRCTYCYENHEPAFMTPEIAERAVEWAFDQAALADATGVSFSFFGGEPLLGITAFRTVVLHGQASAVARGMTVSFRANTNGSLITDELAEFLIEHGVELDLSLDGDRATNDGFRKTRSGESAYESVGGVERIAALQQRGLGIGINMVVGPDTVRALGRNVKLFWDHGITAIQPLPLFDGGRAWTDADLEALDDELGQIAEALLQKLTEDGKDDILDFNPFAKVIRLIGAARDPARARQMRGETYCGIGRQQFSVDVDGNIYACPRFAHESRLDRSDTKLIIGNVVTRYYNPQVLDYFRAWNPRQTARGPCGTCPLALECVYQCVGENLSWNGDEYAVAPIVCRVSAIVHKYASGFADLLFPAATAA